MEKHPSVNQTSTPRAGICSLAETHRNQEENHAGEGETARVAQVTYDVERIMKNEFKSGNADCFDSTMGQQNSDEKDNKNNKKV